MQFFPLFININIIIVNLLIKVEHLAYLQYYTEKWRNFWPRLDSRRSDRSCQLISPLCIKFNFRRARPQRAKLLSSIGHTFTDPTVRKWKCTGREIENRLEKKIIVEEIGRKDKKNWNSIKNIFLKKKIIEIKLE